jgi:hypothetical protein
VTVQADQDRFDGDSCSPDFMCYERWFISTTDTTFAGRIDAKYFAETVGPYRLTVYALNVDAYGYILSGSSTGFFPVPPRQNVTGGYGAFGAWIVRSVPVVGQ